MTTLAWVWIIAALLFGINIGSFLNVVIWRIPRGGSLTSPQFSYCPRCERQLTAIDLVPLFSFLFLGRRCRTCKEPISWRYLAVELLTGLLFMGLAIRFRETPADAVSLMLFAALLVPMTFIDIEFYSIPEQLNLLAFTVAIGRDAWGIVHHEANHALLWGWLPRSILGALVGIFIFGFVRVAGWIWKRREAMGLGDVLLARAMGALLAQLVIFDQSIFRLFPAWVLLSCFTGMIVGIPVLVIAHLKKPEPGIRGTGDAAVELEESEDDEEPTSLKDQFLDIGYCLVLGDLINYVGSKFRKEGIEPGQAIADENFVPEPTAIPFGPFLAIGFLATVFIGEALTASYLAYALPKQ